MFQARMLLLLQVDLFFEDFDVFVSDFSLVPIDYVFYSPLHTSTEVSAEDLPNIVSGCSDSVKADWPELEVHSAEYFEV
jgi:hypothetical protein